MAKFNIEVELDYLDEEQSIDEALRDEIAHSLKDIVTKKATEQVLKNLSTTINELTESLKEKVTNEVDSFLGNTLADKVANMKIPYKENSWSKEIEYIPMSEFVGMRYEEYLNRKVFDYDGREARYSSDRKLSINEYLIKNYLEKELTGKVSKLIQDARNSAEKTVIKTLEQNLQAQLSADMIKRLDIPTIIKSLQEKATLLENKDGDY